MMVDSTEEKHESGLRYEWLESLKNEELKILCENRGISTSQNAKSSAINHLIKSKKRIKYDSLTRTSLILELKAKKINHSIALSTAELIHLCNENKAIKFTKSALSRLTISEIKKLCNRRNIKTNDYSSKKSLIQLLESTNGPDPIFGASMTMKQLTAETKGRGLKASSLKKDQLLKILRSNITYEDQKLESHLNDNDHIIQNTKNALIKFISFVKQNNESIRKDAKHEIMQKKKKLSKVVTTNSLSRDEWNKLSDALQTACDEIIDIRTMIEIYGDTDLGKDENLPQNKNFDNIVPYENDSDIEEEDDCVDIVYVVYEDEQELVMKQSQDAVLAVFNDENQANRFKNKFLKKHKNANVKIQKMKVNDDDREQSDSEMSEN